MNNDSKIDPQDLINALIAQRDAALNNTVQLMAQCASLERQLEEAGAFKSTTGEFGELEDVRDLDPDI